MLPRLRFAEALARYRVEGAVADGVDRAAWQGRAAEDVLRVTDACSAGFFTRLLPSNRTSGRSNHRWNHTATGR